VSSSNEKPCGFHGFMALLKDMAMLHIKRKKKDIANLMKSLVDFMANLKMHAAMVLYYESYIILSAIISAYIEHNKYQLP